MLFHALIQPSRTYSMLHLLMESKAYKFLCFQESIHILKAKLLHPRLRMGRLENDLKTFYFAQSPNIPMETTLEKV